jgi:hypothetical protein
MDQNSEYVKIQNFQVIHFLDKNQKPNREVILIYALGENGIMYEFAGASWTAYPIKSHVEFKKP